MTSRWLPIAQLKKSPARSKRKQMIADSANQTKISLRSKGDKVKTFVLLLALGLGGQAAWAQTPQVTDSKDDVIAVVLGKPITVKDKDRLDGLIFGALLEQFAKDHRIEPTEEELDAFARKTAEMERQHQNQLERDRKKLTNELQTADLSEHERRERQSRLQTIESILASNQRAKEQTGGMEAQMLSVRRQVAWQFVRAWKINKALYAKYGGRVIFQQAGVEPIDAYRDFLKDQQRKGAFRILDKQYEATFWRYFTYDAMHNFYPEEEGARFINTPWWMMDPPPEN